MTNNENIFQKEAKNYDDTIIKIIPDYDKMLDLLVRLIPFPEGASIRVIDLGCGTGTLSLKIKEKYPNAMITCLDIAKDMIELSKLKLRDYEDVTYKVRDLHDYRFDGAYDLIISSLALHHLKGDQNKKNFYKRIFDHLKPNGVFYNLDVVIGTNDFFEKINLSNWVDFLLKSFDLEEIENELLPNYYHKEIPTQLIKQITWMNEIGFQKVDVFWKKFHYAIFGGLKT